MKDEMNNGLISCSDFFVENNKIWLFHEEINALISFDIEEKKAEYITSMDEEKSLEHFLFIKVLKLNEYIVLVPCFAKHLYIYNINTKRVEFKYNVKKIYKNPYVFCDAYIVDRQVVCFPHDIDKPILTVIIDNSYDSRLTYFDTSSVNQGYFNKCCIHENMIYAVNPETSVLTSVNIYDGETIISDIHGVSGLEAVSMDGTYLYLSSSKEKKLIKYDIHKQTTVDQIDVSCDIVGLKCFADGKIWADTTTQFAYSIDMKTRTITSCDKLKYGEALVNIEYKNGAIHNKDDILYYFNKQRSSILKIDESNEIEIPIRLNIDEKKKMIKNISFNEEPINESEFFDLSEFMERM